VRIKFLTMNGGIRIVQGAAHAAKPTTGEVWITGDEPWLESAESAIR